jgi:hypothetical protein
MIGHSDDSTVQKRVEAFVEETRSADNRVEVPDVFEVRNHLKEELVWERQQRGFALSRRRPRTPFGGTSSDMKSVELVWWVYVCFSYLLAFFFLVPIILRPRLDTVVFWLYEVSAVGWKAARKFLPG